MAKGKLILICQSGGELITNGDGTLLYEGGEANAVNISHGTLFDDLKLKLAEMSNLDHKTISIKYFLPGNKRNLITLRNDKDLKRMIGFHVNSVTADIFVDGQKGFDPTVIKAHSSRDSGLKLAETVNHVSTPSVAANTVVRDGKPLDSRKNSVPDDATRLVDVPINSSATDEKNVDSSNRSQSCPVSPLSSENEADNDSDYKPRLVTAVDGAQSSAGFDMDSSPADTVKKRRRTASWMIGVHGPTIVAVSDNDGGERQRKKNMKDHSTLTVNDKIEGEGDAIHGTDGDSLTTVAFCDDDLPEKLVASWKDCITGVGQDFKCVKEFREALQKYAVAHRFVYKLKKNDTNRASGICADEGCSWTVHASWVPASQTFRIKKFNNLHSCGGESWKNAHPAKNLLASVIKYKLRDSPHHKPNDIAKSISQDFGIKLKYTQVRRGMEDAREQLQGSYKESYNRLPWFCEKLMETNPGSSVKLVTNDEKELQRLFISFHSCTQSFLIFCRPILFLNSTSLKSKYQESLLTATAVDADDGFFLVALAIVDGENDDNWLWFLEQLKSAVSISRPLTFVLEREKGLNKLVQAVFENAHHGYSMYHLLESFKRSLKGPFHGEGRGVLPGKFLAAARALRSSSFKKLTEEIKQISENAYDWIMQSAPDHFTSLSFKGEPYNYIIHNVAEPYSKLVDEVRESTIMQKIGALMDMMVKLINTRQKESSTWTMTLTPSKERRIQEAALRAHGLRVFISSNTLFEVHDDSTHVVNIEKWECTCLEWTQKGLPCRHAIAVFNSAGMSLYDYCSRHFTVESYRLTYLESINPIPGIGAQMKKEEGDSSSVQVLPPAQNQQSKEQIKTSDPDKRTVTCSRCKEPGHNRSSCKATLTL
ncbi:uncharacterized protein [Henckelia pumila]